MKKIIVILFSTVFIILTAVMLYANSNGITGLTRKTGGGGCSCHSGSPSPGVVVSITGPDTVAINQVVIYTVTITGGPLVRAGTNIASRLGVIDTIGTAGTRKIGAEITHSSPKLPSGGSVSFQFRYRGPTFDGIDTLYSVGNSVNFNNTTSGDQWNHSPEKFIRVINTLGITQTSTEIPASFSLSQNYPNPFNPMTKIKFQMSNESFANLIIYDVLGNEVATLVNQQLQPGTYEVEWNASAYPSGVYFYRLETESFVETKRMVLIK